jgi:hypothetical protein
LPDVPPQLVLVRAVALPVHAPLPLEPVVLLLVALALDVLVLQLAVALALDVLALQLASVALPPNALLLLGARTPGAPAVGPWLLAATLLVCHLHRPGSGLPMQVAAP